MSVLLGEKTVGDPQFLNSVMVSRLQGTLQNREKYLLESTTRSYQEGGKTTENILEAAIPIVFIIVYPFCLYVLTPEIHLIVCHESPSNSYLEDCPIDPLWK